MKNFYQGHILKNHAELFKTAHRYLVGGVNSPVRSFKSIGGDPVFLKQAKGSKIYAEDGRKLTDYCLSWGAMILGHAYREVVEALEHAVRQGTSYGMPTCLETELAKLIVDAIPSMEQVRLTNSGTEAVMGAIRVARAHTQRDKVVKFEGCYHGHADHLLVKAGSGANTLGIPDSLGVPAEFSKHTLVVPYNNIEQVKETFQQYYNEIAAVIVEPVAGSMGVVMPEPNFLKGLRTLCDEHGALLIFDEVTTGFRLMYGGAQNYLGILPDLTCLGKIIGGGMPIGAFGGPREIMKVLAPLGGAYQEDTLSGNPIVVTAGIATLKCLNRLQPYSKLASATQKLCKGIQDAADFEGFKIRINAAGSMFSFFFTDQKVVHYQSAACQDTDSFREFYQELLQRNIYFSPSPFEANFVSVAHSEKDLENTLQAVRNIFKKMRKQ